MKNIVFIVVFSYSFISYAYVQIGMNVFSSIHNFKPNQAFGSTATYKHDGKIKEDKWDIVGAGLYFTATLNLTDWIKPGFFFGHGTYYEKLNSFNGYLSPEYKVTKSDYGVDLKIFPFRKYLFMRFGYVLASCSHKLQTNNNESVPLFSFSGAGYQAGFGLNFDFYEACFGYNCGFEIEYLVRKAWANSVDMKSSELEYDNSKKPSFREQMLSLGMYWFY